MITRLVNLQNTDNDSFFLFGARQTGKSTLLVHSFPKAIYIDLLQPIEFLRYSKNPQLLIDELKDKECQVVIIDEIQKIPELLDAVHWLITHTNLKFILSGSSARKIKRSGANLLGGRAYTIHLYPLTSAEIPNFNFIHACNIGCLPRHYLSENNTHKKLNAYIGNYLQEEIRAEALTRNLNTFSRFLEVAAFSNGEMVNYQNIATDCGVSSTTIREYFSILEETLIGYFLPAFTKTQKRRVIHAPKFYYFDVGVVNFLLHKKQLQPKTPEFGKALEHLIIMELKAYLSYSERSETLTYWRTSNGYEVDAIIGDAQLAIEVKSTEEVQSRHTKGLKAFREEFPNCRLIMVSLDYKYRILNEVEIHPIMEFLKKLWNNEIF